jgi:mono/diheme cytochrome c family protein
MSEFRKCILGAGWSAIVPLVLGLSIFVAAPSVGAQQPGPGMGDARFDHAIRKNGQGMFQEGRHTFRFDTFGDEAFWGDTLGLHKAIAGAANGGIGPGVSPRTALAVGLKVDVDALPAALVRNIKLGAVNLDDPATTLALLKLDAVVGVKGFFDESGTIKSVGITCALCHTMVDNSLTSGIGHRLDGWPNRDLDVGTIVSLAPNLQPVADLLSLAGTTVTVADVKGVLASWGPGKFDAEVFLDGKAKNPNPPAGVTSAATLIPPAYGLAGVNLHTWTGWGSVTYWNAFVANLEMHGKGTFFDPRLADALQFPIAARAGFDNVRSAPDLITPKLAALHFYQLAIPAPEPLPGSFDKAAAARGAALFNDKAKCATCHTPPLFTEPGWNLHTAQELAIDDFQANRAPDKRYRTAPLKGLSGHWRFAQSASSHWFFHDGRFQGNTPEAALTAVVNHYNANGVGNHGVPLGLTPQEVNDLVEYLKSL